jgi:16S rRNA (adenine1518-N6/adenine1519-N6)-dimethyltransferase
MTRLPDDASPPDWRPRKALGQHFLDSGKVVHRIVAALEVAPGDTLVEVGPGRGAITGDLVGTCNRLILLEKDERFVAEHRRRWAGDPRVEVHEGDAAAFDLTAALEAGERVKVVGNLPYNAGGPILFHLLRHRDRIERLVLMFQREVAERLTALPGERERGASSVLVQARSSVRRLFDVSPTKFRPPPKVWSTVVRVDPAGADPAGAGVADEPGFERLVHGLFAQPRKTVLNSLADGLQRQDKEALHAALCTAAIDPGARPCTLTVTQVVALLRAL